MWPAGLPSLDDFLWIGIPDFSFDHSSASLVLKEDDDIEPGPDVRMCRVVVRRRGHRIHHRPAFHSDAEKKAIPALHSKRSVAPLPAGRRSHVDPEYNKVLITTDPNLPFSHSS